MSDDTQYPQQRTFLQQFCDKHNYEYHSLARPGASNFVINLQVDLARADITNTGTEVCNKFAGRSRNKKTS